MALPRKGRGGALVRTRNEVTWWVPEVAFLHRLPKGMGDTLGAQTHMTRSPTAQRNVVPQP